MRWRYLLCGAAALTLAGCANLTSIARVTDIVSAGSDDNKTAVAVHLDAKQRIFFSDAKALCAEPSPDALSALAASAGASLTGDLNNTASVAQAMQETSASIGLRTQSITLMRDTLYRVCEAYHNDALNDADVIQLLKRSQDLTLGILAIEQLTGVAAARQAIVGGDARAESAAALATTQALLDNAKRTEESRKTEAEKAKKEWIEADGKLKEHKKLKPEEQNQEQLNALEKDASDKKKVSDAAEQRHADAQNIRRKIEENRDSAFAGATASASGFGQYAGLVGGGLDPEATGQIASAVEKIVTTIVNKGHLTETCINFMAHPPKKNHEAEYSAEELQFRREYCGKAITSYLRAYDRYNENIGSVPAPTVAPKPPKGVKPPSQPKPPAPPAPPPPPAPAPPPDATPDL